MTGLLQLLYIHDLARPDALYLPISVSPRKIRDFWVLPSNVLTYFDSIFKQFLACLVISPLSC